jgi:hypothetical protein
VIDCGVLRDQKTEAGRLQHPDYNRSRAIGTLSKPRYIR